MRFWETFDWVMRSTMVATSYIRKTPRQDIQEFLVVSVRESLTFVLSWIHLCGGLTRVFFEVLVLQVLLWWLSPFEGDMPPQA